MAELDAAVFKFGQRPVVGLGCITVASRISDVFQQGLAAQHFKDLLGIRLPVGCAMQVAAGFQARGQLGNERRLDQPALVVFFFCATDRQKRYARRPGCLAAACGR